VPSTKRGEPPFSMDANLLHISYEGNALEDPWAEPDESMFTRSVSPEDVSAWLAAIAVVWCLTLGGQVTRTA
jgi:argininosuccinate synthase